jgi:hypothetical protein
MLALAGIVIFAVITESFKIVFEFTMGFPIPWIELKFNDVVLLA